MNTFGKVQYAAILVFIFFFSIVSISLAASGKSFDKRKSPVTPPVMAGKPDILPVAKGKPVTPPNPDHPETPATSPVKPEHPIHPETPATSPVKPEHPVHPSLPITPPTR